MGLVLPLNRWIRAFFLCLLCCAVSAPLPASASRMCQVGPVEEARSPYWPIGEPLLLSPHRVLSADINGNCYVYFRGDIPAINGLLADFAKVAMQVHDVVFCAAAPLEGVRSEHVIPYNAKLHIPGGFYLDHAKEYPNEAVYPTFPRLTVYVDTTLASQLDQFRIPDGVRVRGVADDLDLIIEALKSPEKELRRAASQKLAKVGGFAAAAAEELIAAVRDEDAHVRGYSITALGNCWPAIENRKEEVTEVLLQACDDEKPRNRAAAARALAELGLADDARVAPRLAEILDEAAQGLKEGDEKARVKAAGLLREMGAKAAAPVLSLLLDVAAEDESVGVRRAAIRTLGHVGRADERLHILLNRLAQEEADESLQYEARYALQAIARDEALGDVAAVEAAVAAFCKRRRPTPEQ